MEYKVLQQTKQTQLNMIRKLSLQFFFRFLPFDFVRMGAFAQMSCAWMHSKLETKWFISYLCCIAIFFRFSKIEHCAPQPQKQIKEINVIFFLSTSTYNYIFMLFAIERTIIKIKKANKQKQKNKQKVDRKIAYCNKWKSRFININRSRRRL